MGVFADSTAHSGFLATYLVRVLAYTAGMVVVLYIAAGLIKGAKPPVYNVSTKSSSSPHFWKTVWQRFVVTTQSVMPAPTVKTPTPPPSEHPILTARQILPLDTTHTAHLLDSPDGRWLLVTGPTGTQLHALQGANSVDLGSRSSSLVNGGILNHSNVSATPKIPVIRPPLGVPDGWGHVSLVANS